MEQEQVHWMAKRAENVSCLGRGLVTRDLDRVTCPACLSAIEAERAEMRRADETRASELARMTEAEVFRGFGDDEQ